MKVGHVLSIIMEIRKMYLLFGSVFISVTSVLTMDLDESCFVAPSDLRSSAKHFVKIMQSEIENGVNVALRQSNKRMLLKHLNVVQSTLSAFEIELTDCFIDSQEYTGKRNCTESGLPCMHWKSHVPHEHIYTEFPDGSVDKAENYCRDPNGSGTLWCYTADPKVRHQDCIVPRCDTLQ